MVTSTNRSSSPQSTTQQAQSAAPHGREQELKTPASVTGAGETSVPRSQADDSSITDESSRRQSDSGSTERSEDVENKSSQGV